MIYGIIYLTTNTVNNKIYIGQTTRSDKKYIGSGLMIKRAIKKYGKNAFITETLDSAMNQKELDAKEICWIDKKQPEYNLQKGGRGGKHSDATRLKMSESHTGKNLSKIHKDNISKGNVGKVCSEESKRKIGSANKIKLTGRKLSEETKKKMAQSRIGNKNAAGAKRSDEYKLNLSKLFSGNKSPRYIDIDKNELLELRQTNLSYRKLAKIFNVSKQVIQNRLKEIEVKQNKENNYEYGY